MPMLPLDPDTLLLPTAEARAAAAPHSETYRGRKPFPYGGYDDFLAPEILDRVKEELKVLPEVETSFDRPQERLKNSYIPERLPEYTRRLFYALNSRPVIAFLEELTGIKGLIPDPYFAGGGVHVVRNGGHLDIHADFNHHAALNLERFPQRLSRRGFRFSCVSDSESTLAKEAGMDVESAFTGFTRSGRRGD